MSTETCSQCGAELLPEVNFCRQCGVSTHQTPSELPTAILNQAPPDSSTRRLEGRETSPAAAGYQGQPQNYSVSKKRRWAPVILIGVVVLIAMGSLAWAAFVHNRNPVIAEDAWVYPGSETIVNTTTPEGRAIQLRTTDPLDKVVAWYTSRLKPAKTMKLNESTVVLRNGPVTVTLSAEHNVTTILIKETTP